MELPGELKTGEEEEKKINKELQKKGKKSKN